MNIAHISTDQLIHELRYRLTPDAYRKHGAELDRLAWDIINESEAKYETQKRRA
jgi:hypothetical protein